MNRDSILKGLAVLSAVVLVLFVGFLIVKIVLNDYRKDLKAEPTEAVTLDANNALKDMLKAKTVPEDQERRAQEDVQKLTDRYIVEVEKALSAKEADLMAI